MGKRSYDHKIVVLALTVSWSLILGGCSAAGRGDIAKGGNSPLPSDSSGKVTETHAVKTDSPSEITEALSEAATVTNPVVSEVTGTVTSAADDPFGADNIEVFDGMPPCITFRRNNHWWGVQLYGGGYNRKLYVDSVNKFAEDLEGVAKVYSMIAPTNSEFYCPPGFEDKNASQLDDIKYIAENLSKNVTNVDCYSVLKQHANNDIYFRTDHHWKVIAAYYAAEQYTMAGGVPFAELDDVAFEKKEIEGFIGSLYGSTGNENLKNDPDEFVYFIPKNDFKCYYYDMSYNLDGRYPFFLQMDGKNAFGTFMGSDKKIVRIETDFMNGKKLMVIKDSYGNLEIPFFMNSYEEIYVADVRFFDLNAIDFIKEHKIDDVLFTMCSASATGQNCAGIEMMRTGAGHLIDW